MNSFTYDYIVDTIKSKLVEKSAQLGVETTSIIEDAEGVNQSVATPFLVINATPQEVDLKDAGELILSNKLEVIIFAGVASSMTSGEATRSAMNLAGRVLTVLEDARNSNDLFATLFTSTTPINYVGTWSNKTMVSIHFEIDFSPYSDLL
jgi:hypothetical protein